MDVAVLVAAINGKPAQSEAAAEGPPHGPRAELRPLVVDGRDRRVVLDGTLVLPLPGRVSSPGIRVACGSLFSRNGPAVGGDRYVLDGRVGPANVGAAELSVDHPLVRLAVKVDAPVDNTVSDALRVLPANKKA